MRIWLCASFDLVCKFNGKFSCYKMHTISIHLCVIYLCNNNNEGTLSADIHYTYHTCMTHTLWIRYTSQPFSVAQNKSVFIIYSIVNIASFLALIYLQFLCIFHFSLLFTSTLNSLLGSSLSSNSNSIHFFTQLAYMWVFSIHRLAPLYHWYNQRNDVFVIYQKQVEIRKFNRFLNLNLNCAKMDSSALGHKTYRISGPWNRNFNWFSDFIAKIEKFKLFEYKGDEAKEIKLCKYWQFSMRLTI